METPITRDNELTRLTDALYAARGDAVTQTAEYQAAVDEMIAIEYRVAATCVSSADIVDFGSVTVSAWRRMPGGR